MKLLSFILSIHVLFLTGLPTISIIVSSLTNNNHVESCCSDIKENTYSKQTTNCKNGTCNPFMACCNSFILTVPKVLVVPHCTYLNQKIHLTIQVFSSDFSSDAWNPPKEV